MTTKEALDHLKQAMLDDPDYANTWHCNIAVPIQDCGISHQLANVSATRIMQTLFKVKTEYGI